MKNFYTMLLVLWISNISILRAQESGQNSDPLRQKLDQVFANINKSYVPYSHLEEYGTPLIPLDVFNGTLTDSSLTNIDIFRMAYAT